MNIIEKLETIGLNLCETFNLISYRDKEIVEWNRSGILLVTSIFITMIMMTIAIFNGFPAPMGCVPKTCFTDCILPTVKQNSYTEESIDNLQSAHDHQEEVVTTSRWTSSKLYLLRDR